LLNAAGGRGRTRPVALMVAVGLGLLGLVLYGALLIALPVFQFPQPGGPYSIGTLTYHWVDTNRAEAFSADASARRELMVQIWYPAKAGSSTASPPSTPPPYPPPRAPYVQDGDELAKAFSRLTPLPQALFRQFKHVTTHAVSSAPVADGRPNYPVLLFLQGAIGFRQMNTFQAEALVSQGYIVVALDQPYTAATVVFPDGREVGALPLAQMMPLIHQSYSPTAIPPTLNGQRLEKGIVPYLAQDVSFTLNQLTVLNQADSKALLTGRLDLVHVGVFGVSLGGIVAAEACRQESRLKACLFMDAPMPVVVVKSGLPQSAMWITRDADTMRLERRRSGGWPEGEINEHLTSMRAVFNSMQGNGYFVQVPGMFHINLTDIPLWSPVLRWLRVIGPIDAQQAHDITNAYSLAFFNRHLLGQAAVLLDAPASEFPEVMFTARQP
jgi:predicted dienelactone hydrolase